MESENCRRMGQLIYQYLCDHNLPRIACLTTCAPTRHDKDYLVEYFNYICFCASSRVQLARFLLRRYLLRLGRTPFDVVIDTPLSCLLSRRFGYVCVETDDPAFVSELLLGISDHRRAVAREYPILLRVKGRGFADSLRLPSACLLLEEFDETDTVFEVK